MVNEPEILPKIRLACQKDIPTILEISNRAARETPANFAIQPEKLDFWESDWVATHLKFPWFVADHDGAVIGFAKASPWKGRCAYERSAETTVYLQRRYHRRGIGRSLYQSLIPCLQRQGYHSVLAGITLPNPASVRLHESFGLKKVAHLEQVGWKFDRWHDVGYWMRILQNTDATPCEIQNVRDVVSES